MRIWITVAATIMLLAASCADAPAAPPLLHRQLGSVPQPSGRDITFLAAADAHFGVDGIEARHRVQIAAMNSMEGKAYPDAIGGVVGRPLALLYAGDLTELGLASEWRKFVAFYGLTGKDGLLNFPVFEGTGNHDRLPFPSWFRGDIRERHGSLPYSFDIADVHFVCLDEYPHAGNLRWLMHDLNAVGRDVPVVIYFHYALGGPFSENWSEEEKEAFAEAISGYRVLGIFHGHVHSSRHYKWKGYDVYLIGSPKHSKHRFLVGHISDRTMTVAAWNWDQQRWDWHHEKSIGR